MLYALLRRPSGGIRQSFGVVVSRSKMRFDESSVQVPTDFFPRSLTRSRRDNGSASRIFHRHSTGTLGGYDNEYKIMKF